MTDKPKTRGFASMDPEKRRLISQMGGRAVPAEKRSYFVNRDLASKSGHKGGVSVAPERRSFSVNRELASTAGRKARGS